MRLYVFVLSFLCAITFLGTAQAEEKSGEMSETDRISYSLGHQVGIDLNRQRVELDAGALMRGFKDVQSGSQPVLDPDAIQSILSELKDRVTNIRGTNIQNRPARQDYRAKEKLSEGREFLAENADKPGVKVLPSGLQYKVLKEGTGRVPGSKDKVQVNYRARLINGREFDSSYRGDGPVSLQIDKVIRGLGEALQMMRVGARWELYIPPELAFGRREPLDNQTVIYDIDLVGIEEEGSAADKNPDSRTPQ